ncbi:MAG TPA: glycosyltransferase [Nitrospiria bacterium]|nr:glycosyltransferase [Nitrospiria bacterium]
MTTVLNFNGRDRVMVLAPHPDDETLAAGGLLQIAIAAGAPVRVIFVTDGENNPWPQRALERRWRIGPDERIRWGRRRRAEVRSAFAVLGVPEDNAVFLGYPDQGLTPLLMSGRNDLVTALTREIEAWRPTKLAIPSELDGHPDHSAFAVLASFALARLTPDRSGLMPIRYLIHCPRSRPPERSGFLLPVAPSVRARKREAILRYASQLLLSRRRFLSYAADHERFMAAADPIDRDDAHPVRFAAVENKTLRLKWAMRMRPTLRGRAVLYLAGDDPSGRALRLSIALPRRPAGVADVRDGVSGAVIACARLYGNRRRGEVLLPLSLFPPVQKMFVKLESRPGFFDEAGWREVPIHRPRGGVVSEPSVRGGAIQCRPVICCVIPCYNVAALCEAVVREAAAHADHVIAVDDGSTDGTGEVLHRIQAEGGGRVRVVSFPVNRGKGGALLEAFRLAISEWPFDLLVTVDGDGQHRPADIPRLVRAWKEKGASLVIGERVQFGAMPLRSRIGNTLTSALLRRLYPESPLDTQSGLRALDRNFVREVVQSVQGRRYETEMKILLLALGHHRRIGTVPIQTVYLNGNRSSHFRPVLDSLRIYWVLFNGRRPVPESDPCSEKAL